jgi:HEAT repeat protein
VLRALRDRRMPEMIPRVIEMLSDPNPDVAMEAVGVLVAQKEKRAAVPLIRMAQGRDNVFLFQIITALSEIQGPVAKGYLFTLAAGHDLPDVRKRAREAFDRILREEGANRSGRKKKEVAFPRHEPEKPAPGGAP